MFSMWIKIVKDYVACTRKIKVYNKISWCLLNSEREDDGDYKNGLRPWVEISWNLERLHSYNYFEFRFW